MLAVWHATEQSVCYGTELVTGKCNLDIDRDSRIDSHWFTGSKGAQRRRMRLTLPMLNLGFQNRQNTKSRTNLRSGS